MRNRLPQRFPHGQDSLLAWWERVRRHITNQPTGSDSSFVTVSGGDDHSAQAEYSTILGGLQARTTLYGQVAHASGYLNFSGDSQWSRVLLRKEITGASSQELFLDGAAQTERLVLQDDQTWGFHGFVVCDRQGASQASMYEVKGLIRRGTGVASTVLVGSTVTTLYEDTGGVPGAPTLAANTSVGALTVTMPGVAAQTWGHVCSLLLVEVAE